MCGYAECGGMPHLSSFTRFQPNWPPTFALVRMHGLACRDEPERKGCAEAIVLCPGSHRESIERNLSMDLVNVKRASGLALVAVVLCLSAASAIAPVSAHAAPQITTKISRFTMPAAQCAKLKAALPQVVSDPAVCTITHVEKSTALPAQGAPTAAAACFAGSRTFSDTFTDGIFWQVRMDSTFHWTGCSNPTVSITTCRQNWTAFGYTLSGVHCSSYTTSIPSRAALLEGYAHLPDNIANYYFFIRRECYSGGPGTCNFNWG